MTKPLYAGLALAGFLLSGCAVQRLKEVKKDAGDTEVKASSLIAQMGDNYPVVTFRDRQYVNPIPLPKPKYDVPPQMASCQVQYKTVQPQDIFQFAQDISEQCRVRVRVTPDAAAAIGGSSGVSGSSTQRLASVPSPKIDAGDMKPLAMFGAANSTAAPVAVARTITDVNYSGALAGILDLVTGRLGISWKYENNEVVFYHLETKRFDIQPTDAMYKLDGSVTSGLSNSTGTDSSSSGSSGSNSGVSGVGGSTMTSTVDMGNNLYRDLKITLESMLTPGVGRLSLNATTGTVIVTDVPDAVRRIGEYIDDENGTLSKQVILKVVTYTITRDISDMVGIDWSLVWKSLSGDYGISLANTNSDTSTDAISGDFNVLDTASGAAAQFAGSSFLLNALSQQARVSDVQNNTIMTTNMAAGASMAGLMTTYLKNSESTPYTSGDEIVNSQTLEPGSVTTGTNITIFPKILKGSDRLMLNLFLDISSLKQLRVISNDTQKIEAPDVSIRSLKKRVWLKPGQTLVISGFEQNTDNSTHKGVGEPENILFGGSLSGSKVKQSFVMTVTPYVR